MRQLNKFKSILTILILVAICVAGQDEHAFKTVLISPYVLDKKVSILCQSDSFIVLASTSYLIDLFGQSTRSSNSLKYESKLFTECHKTAYDTVNLYSCAKQKSLDHLVVNLAADLIDKKACVVLWKKTNKVITNLLVKPYDHFDVGGMAYYVGETLLFETIERVY